MDDVKTQTAEANGALPGIAVADDEAQAREVAEQAAVDFRMVTFSLSGKDYAIDIMDVKEIAKAGNFTYVPNTFPFVVGVYNLRGDIIPVLDMRLFFNIEIPARKENALENLLFLTVDDQTFGIIVDKIDKVVGVQKSMIQPPHPLFGDINVKYILGVVESDSRLYVLLDIRRIFVKGATEERKQMNIVPPAARPEQPAAGKAAVPVKPDAASAQAAVAEEKDSFDSRNYGFVTESLKKLRKFTVSEVNEGWTKHRFEEWAERKGDSVQLQGEKDADEFLSTFWSHDSGTWWTSQYADEIYKMLPDNSAKQIVVWNPGCGKGHETYCLACVLRRRYPDAKIRIYAQDVDLLNISNAPLLTVPQDAASGWLAPYLSSTAAGAATFSQDIKDSVMFEYHDCQHSNALPMTDIIFARDIISMLDSEAQKGVLSDFNEKLKGNGIVIVGENETIPPSLGFSEHTVGRLTAYNKQ